MNASQRALALGRGDVSCAGAWRGDRRGLSVGRVVSVVSVVSCRVVPCSVLSSLSKLSCFSVCPLEAWHLTTIRQHGQTSHFDATTSPQHSRILAPVPSQYPSLQFAFSHLSPPRLRHPYSCTPYLPSSYLPSSPLTDITSHSATYKIPALHRQTDRPERTSSTSIASQTRPFGAAQGPGNRRRPRPKSTHSVSHDPRKEEASHGAASGQAGPDTCARLAALLQTNSTPS